MAKRRLGRGLDALLGGGDEAERVGLPAEGGGRSDASGAEVTRVPLAEIEPNPYQPRRAFDPLELDSLVESVRQHGVLQPVLVRRLGDKYQLLAGERRLRAAREAGMARVPARVMEVDDRQVAELAIVENLQRTDLNAIEKARAFRDYLERFGCTQDELATRLALDRSTVSNFVRLLELPEAIQQAAEAGKVSQGHARALLACTDRARQHELCQRIVREGLSVRQIESLVGAERKPRGGRDRREGLQKTSHVVDLEGLLRDRLGARVEIRLRGKDRGQIVIEFSSNDDFERILETIQGRTVAPTAA